MYTLYILKCNDNSLYTGITNDIKKRMLKHSKGLGSKYVRSRLPFKIVYTKEFDTKSDALKKEFEIKTLSKVDKLNLINNLNS